VVPESSVKPSLGCHLGARLIFNRGFKGSWLRVAQQCSFSIKAAIMLTWGSLMHEWILLMENWHKSKVLLIHHNTFILYLFYATCRRDCILSAFNSD